MATTRARDITAASADSDIHNAMRVQSEKTAEGGAPFRFDIGKTM
jgi:hypothetical protein